MNYRHAYHAGNLADVPKHAVLALAPSDEQNGTGRNRGATRIGKKR